MEPSRSFVLSSLPGARAPRATLRGGPRSLGLLLVPLAVLGPLLTGCNDILGIGEPIPGSGTGGAGTSTTSGTTGGAGGTAGSGGGGTAGSGGGLPCDPAEVPSDGIFLSPDGDDDAGDGSATLPVKTLARALELSLSGSKHAIHLDQGTYPAQLTIATLPPGPPGPDGAFLIDGGWMATGAAWTRDCSAGARSKTVIASPTSTGASIALQDGSLILRTLTIAGKATGATSAGLDGESCYGIAVLGSGELRLEDVDAKAGTAGDGGEVTQLVDGMNAACNPDGVSSCAALPQGQAGSTGGPGVDGPAGTDGTFGQEGYQPAPGGDGTPGDPGQNGGPGAAGASGQCYDVGCAGAPVPPCNTAFCGSSAQHPVNAGKGKCGCGGRGGAAGAAGRGGGASIGVFAFGTVTVLATVSSLTAGDGGDGSPGAGGLPGDAGTSGAKGTNAACPAVCASVSIPNNQCQCQQPGSTTLDGGAKGGDGGMGGTGAKGGGGSGGPSIAVVRGGGATVTLTSTTTKVGKGGVGADGAKDGASQPELMLP